MIDTVVEKGAYMVRSGTGPLELVTPDMPEAEKNLFFEAFMQNPRSESLIRILNDALEPISLSAIIRRTRKLFNQTPQESDNDPLSREQVAAGVDFLNKAFGFVERQDDRRLQLTTEGRVYVGRQINLINDLSQSSK